MTQEDNNNKIVLFKMVNGQELICKVREAVADGWIVSDVREIAPQANPNGQGWVLTLAPFVLGTMGQEQSVQLYRQAVAARVVDIPEKLEREFLSATSGIAIAKAGSIK